METGIYVIFIQNKCMYMRRGNEIFSCLSEGIRLEYKYCFYNNAFTQYTQKLRFPYYVSACTCIVAHAREICIGRSLDDSKLFILHFNDGGSSFQCAHSHRHSLDQ